MIKTMVPKLPETVPVVAKSEIESYILDMRGNKHNDKIILGLNETGVYLLKRVYEKNAQGVHTLMWEWLGLENALDYWSEPKVPEAFVKDDLVDMEHVYVLDGLDDLGEFLANREEYGYHKAI